jgi:hypothetical protein
MPSQEVYDNYLLALYGKIKPKKTKAKKDIE